LARIIARESGAGATLSGVARRPARPGELNVDETGHKRTATGNTCWCFRAGLYTLFKIDPTRSADVLIEVLARVDGVLGAIFLVLPALSTEFGVLSSSALAHLIRHVKYLDTLPMRGTRTARGCVRRCGGCSR